ncbi:MAG TPA: hypothetical protein VGD40_19525 [Chryseosolibacter sp.]
MTQKKLFLFIGIGVVLLLIAKIGFNLYSKVEAFSAEREWYGTQLHYDFSSSIDSVKFLDGNVGPAKLYCTLTKGTLDPSIEDSLGKKLQHFTYLRFNESRKEDKIRFVMPGAERFVKGYCVVVNSIRDQIQLFRKRSEIYSDRFSNLLEARVTR